MPDINKEAELLAAHGIVMLLLADYLKRQPNPNEAARLMLDTLPTVLAESYGEGLPEPLLTAAGKAVHRFIEDAHTIQGLWPSVGRKPTERH